MKTVSLVTSPLSVMLLLGGCAGGWAVPASNTGQPVCALTTYPPNVHIGAWSVDKFAGEYAHGADKITIRRDEHRLLVEGRALGLRELTASSVESWTWHDGCGVRYEFVLPPDGPGAWLKVITPDGRITDWHR